MAFSENLDNRLHSDLYFGLDFRYLFDAKESELVSFHHL